MHTSPNKTGNEYPVIFTTGAFLKPIKVTENGRKTWRWVVVSFEDDSYYEGTLINPPTAATHSEKLLTVFADD